LKIKSILNSHSNNLTTSLTILKHSNPLNRYLILTSLIYNMMTKCSLLALALAAIRVQGQEFKNIDLYSIENCDPDPNDLEVQSFQLGFSPKKDAKGNDYSGCIEASIVPTGWPTTENGKYPVWVDTTKFDKDCSMLFFNLPGSEEEGDIWPCKNGLYRRVQKNRTSCGDLELTQRFGYA
jgi:hypothetical protein